MKIMLRNKKVHTKLIEKSLKKMQIDWYRPRFLVSFPLFFIKKFTVCDKGSDFYISDAGWQCSRPSLHDSITEKFMYGVFVINFWEMLGLSKFWRWSDPQIKESFEWVPFNTIALYWCSLDGAFGRGLNSECFLLFIVPIFVNCLLLRYSVLWCINCYMC